LEVDLLIGAELVRAAAGHAQGGAAKRLRKWAELLGDDKGDPARRFGLAGSEELRQAVAFCCDRSLGSSAGGLFLIERERAAFSSWYEFFPRSCGPDERTHGT